MSEMPTTSQETALGYIAGFLDGEGHITIRRCNLGKSANPSYQVVVGFTNRDLRPLEKIQRRYGGRIYAKARARAQHRPAWDLVIFRRAETEAILRDVGPLLLIKREAAELALALIELGRQRKVVLEVRGKSWPRYGADPADVAARESLRTALRLVNGRGC